METTRPAPPPRTGGWSDIRSGEPVLFNCDGLRTPVLSNGPAAWGGVAVVPGPAGDLDLHLHETGTGAKGGFTASLGISSWGAGESEYVLVDFLATPRRAFDAGVVNVNDGTEEYTIQAESAERQVPSPAGSLGPFALGPQKLFALHEVVLSAGDYHVRLVNTGGVDLGVSAHEPGQAFQSKSEAVAAAWLNGPGEDEELDVTALDAGTHVFPVWRVSDSGLDVAAPYEIEITSSSLDVPGGGAPTVTHLTRVTPNPFLSSAVLSFDLAEAEEITLDVFGPGGARVRTLAEGLWSAGRHEVVWTGDGDDGRRLPAGVYFVRLEAGSLRTSSKVIKMR